MNMYRNVDRSKVQFDFLLRSDENIYEDEINKLGGKIYYTASFPKHYLKNKYQVRSILKNNQYEAVSKYDINEIERSVCQLMNFGD